MLGLLCHYSQGAILQVTTALSDGHLLGCSWDHESWHVDLSHDHSGVISGVWHPCFEARGHGCLQVITRVWRWRVKWNTAEIRSEHGEETSCCVKGMGCKLLLVLSGAQQWIDTANQHLFMSLFSRKSIIFILCLIKLEFPRTLVSHLEQGQEKKLTFVGRTSGFIQLDLYEKHTGLISLTLMNRDGCYCPRGSRNVFPHTQANEGVFL